MTLPCWKWNRIEFPQFLIFYRLKVNSRSFHFRTINSYIMFFSGKGLINPAVIICREISEHVVHCEQRSRDGDGRKILDAYKPDISHEIEDKPQLKIRETEALRLPHQRRNINRHNSSQIRSKEIQRLRQ